MKRLNVNNITGTNNIIRMQKPNAFYSPGNIVQVAYSICEERYYQAVPRRREGFLSEWGGQAQHGGVPIEPLNVVIEPRSENSWMLVEFHLFYEVSNDVNFVILRDENLVGSQYYGSDVNQGVWSSLAPSRYDNNDDSTPSYLNCCCFDRPGRTTPVTYKLATISSNGNNYTARINVTHSNYVNGADAYEIGVSFGIVQEIAY